MRGRLSSAPGTSPCAARCPSPLVEAEEGEARNVVPEGRKVHHGWIRLRPGVPGAGAERSRGIGNPEEIPMASFVLPDRRTLLKVLGAGAAGTVVLPPLTGGTAAAAIRPPLAAG